MKFVESKVCDAINEKVMTSEAQERVPIKISWPNLKVCSIKYGL